MITANPINVLMATCLEKQKNNFSFNREVNENRLKRLKIMLPVDDHGQPDYQFMADYERQLIRHKREQRKQPVQNIRHGLLKKYMAFFSIS
uniref:restriction endonuclease subunit S n=1 Tax=Limosilactobacillus reuteri TaxID=1598 RepID=UPI003D80BFFC